MSANSMIRNNCDDQTMICRPALPKVYGSIYPDGTRPHPTFEPILIKDAWNERSWHSMRKALNASKIADNAVKDAYRFLQWSEDRGSLVERFVKQALNSLDQEIPVDNRDGMVRDSAGRPRFWFPNPVLSELGFVSDREATAGSPFPDDMLPPMGEFIGKIKSPHWF